MPFESFERLSEGNFLLGAVLEFFVFRLMSQGAKFCTYICLIEKFAVFLPKRAIYCTMNFEIIKERRNLLGLTQQDLADYTGLSLRIIKSIESGKGNPSVGNLRKIADILGLEISLTVKNLHR